MASLEKNLQNRAIEYLRSRGKHWIIEKRHGGSMGVAGMPDLSCCCRGLAAQLELKAPGKKPTRLQQRWLDRYREAGAIAMTADDMEGVERFAWIVEARCAQLGLGAGSEALNQGNASSAH